MAGKLDALPSGSLVLVTGANGYIASNIIDYLLNRGFKVRGTTRASKAWLDELFQKKYSPEAFESIVVPSLEEEHSVRLAMQGVAGVVHVAGDVSFEKDPAVVIPKSVKLTQVILAAAAEQVSMKRFVMTSSSAAAIIPVANKTGICVDENSWNEIAVKAAWDPDTPDAEKGYVVYAACKAESERAAWKWIKENRPGFTFSTVLPNWTVGRNLSPEIPGSSNGLIKNLLSGDKTAFSLFRPQYYVNVEDVARIHMIALLGSQIEGQRIYAFAGATTLGEMIGILRELQPQNEKIPAPPPNEGHDLTEIAPIQRAEELLKEYFHRDGWVSLRDSLKSSIEGF